MANGGTVQEPTLDELREQWAGLAESDTLALLPKEALIASIKDLANALLRATGDGSQ